MAKRVESPSSINTFKQCKRKYYYSYIEKLPRSKSIHTVRGNIAHSALEDFYDVDVSVFEKERYHQQFKVALQKLLLKQWGAYKEELDSLHLDKEKLQFYFEETLFMLLNWCKYFLEEFDSKLPSNNDSLVETFKVVTPTREKEYRSESHSVRGFVDAIRFVDDEVHIIDYKTNSKSEVKDSIKLQLAIYCMLYEEEHGVLPNKVGVFFLRDRLKMLDVDVAMVERAKREIKAIHAQTSSTEKEEDYTKTITGLCKWRTGQCDFYDTCKPHSKGYNRRFSSY
jgi:RecB family exonuclease